MTLVTFDELLAVDVSDVVMGLLSDTAWYNMHVHVHCMACTCTCLCSGMGVWLVLERRETSYVKSYNYQFLN